MTGRTTKPYKNTLSGSVGAGMGSLFSPSGRKYYILEHKVSSKYHKAGESQEIIVDNIELGRDSLCQVRFDENFHTVSRHHAGIVKDGDMWKLVQISKKNSTFLNGRPIKTEWYLQSGDEIQLAVNGPKLGFIIPTGKKSTVASIGLTRRLSLFRQQALRPYKYAIATLSCILVLAVSGLGTWNYFLKEDLAKQSILIAQQIDELTKQKGLTEANKAKADSLAGELVENNKKIAGYEDKIAALRKNVASANARAAAAYKKAAEASVSVGPGPEALQGFAKNTYYCELIILYRDKPVSGSSGSGFLLSNGKFVTALHVIDPYPAPTDEDATLLNAIMNQSPTDITCQFTAVSPGGDKFSKSFSPNQNPFHMGGHSMETLGTIEFQGMKMPVRVTSFSSRNDYAWISIGKSGGMESDAAFSTSMPVKTHLDILGFPKGVGAENASNISPIYSESSVAREGLDTDGCILLANSETDHGNSGGPVIAAKDGKFVVVGILTGSNRLGSKGGHKSTGKWKDRVVPIANVR